MSGGAKPILLVAAVLAQVSLGVLTLVYSVPVLLAVGQREVENRSVAVRRLGSKQQKVLPLGEAIAALETEVQERR